MPFMPIFLIGCFMIHPGIGVMSVVGGVVIIILTLYTDAKSKGPSYEVTKSGAERHAMAETSRRNAEAIRAIGMLGFLAKRYDEVHVRHVNDGLRRQRVLGRHQRLRQGLPHGAPVGHPGPGRLLRDPGPDVGRPDDRRLDPDVPRAGSHRDRGRALEGLHRLPPGLSPPRAHHVRSCRPRASACRCRPPRPTLSVEDVYVGAPGASLPIVQAATLQLQAGQGLGLIGPSASGKSTLARALVGVWPTLRGEIRLDGAALDQWEPDPLGRHIGYLPQDVELFEGTIAENISRFQPDAKPEDVIAAAQTAGAHELILNLPDGYDTRIGEGGASLSGGQRQRVALARALYGNPFLVVLDEPNASLDGAGDEALNQAILAVRKRGGIVVVITHRPAALGQVDQVAIMEEGRIKAVGPRDEVLQSVMKRNAAAPAPGAPAAGAGRSRPLTCERLVKCWSFKLPRRNPPPTSGSCASRPSRGVAMIALFGGTIGLWAATSTLSGAVVAGGQFVVDTSVKKIQHSTGGIVGELKVQEGDRVSQGDLLVRLDETVTRANLQVVSKQLDEYLGRQARLEAERDGTADDRDAGGVRQPPRTSRPFRRSCPPSGPCSSHAAPPARRRRTSSRSASPSPRTRSWD